MHIIIERRLHAVNEVSLFVSTRIKEYNNYVSCSCENAQDGDRRDCKLCVYRPVSCTIPCLVRIRLRSTQAHLQQARDLYRVTPIVHAESMKNLKLMDETREKEQLLQLTRHYLSAFQMRVDLCSDRVKTRMKQN